MNSNEAVKPPSSGTEEVRAPLLPSGAVERIKAKETAQLQAKAERQQKRSEAERLADVIRREQLRQIPQTERSTEQQKEFRRLEQRRYRAGASKGNILCDVSSAEQFWEANRLLLPKKKLDEYLAQQELVLDQIAWMKRRWACPPQDPDFVSLEEGLVDLDRFIAEHGLIHDDSSVYQHYVLQDFRPSWGIWATKTIFDPIWGTITGFWRDERLPALCEENEPTAIYAKYGIGTALSAYAVRMFKFRIDDHQRSRSLGTWKRHVEYEGEKCWLCNFERLWAVQS